MEANAQGHGIYLGHTMVACIDQSISSIAIWDSLSIPMSYEGNRSSSPFSHIPIGRRIHSAAGIILPLNIANPTAKTFNNTTTSQLYVPQSPVPLLSRSTRMYAEK